jgi:hypothetical protein
MMRFDGHNGFWLLRSPCSIFRGPKRVRANAPRRSTTGPVTVFVMWFKKTGKQKEAAHAREADNWRYTLMAR